MKIEQDILNWHRETFPRATDYAVHKKFAEEINELRESLDHDIISVANEIADVFISGTAFLDRHGISLERVIREKFDIVKQRDYKSMPEDEHGDRVRIR